MPSGSLDDAPHDDDTAQDPSAANDPATPDADEDEADAHDGSDANDGGAYNGGGAYDGSGVLYNTGPPPATAPAEPKHVDSRPARPSFRISRPKHLRDEVPLLPLPNDPWHGPAALDVTLVGETVPAEPDPRARATTRRRAWLAGAATIVAVAAAASFAMWGAPSTADRGPDFAVTGGDVTVDPDRQSEPPAGTPSPGGTATATTSRSPGPTRTATSTSTATTPSTTPALTPTFTPTTQPPVPTTPPPPVGPTLVPVPPHTATIVSASGLCLDDNARLSNENNPIQVYVCNATPAQDFTFTAGGALQVIGKCIRPAGAWSGAPVSLRTCDGSVGQSWYFRSDKVIINKGSGLCLTNSGAIINGLPQATVSTCTAAVSQRWTFN